MANIGYGSNKKTRHTLPSGAFFFWEGDFSPRGARGTLPAPHLSPPSHFSLSSLFLSLPSLSPGFKKFVIHNPAELEILLMHNRTYAAEVAHGVGARKRALIVARAKELNVNLTNGAAKVRSQEDA